MFTIVNEFFYVIFLERKFLAKGMYCKYRAFFPNSRGSCLYLFYCAALARKFKQLLWKSLLFVQSFFIKRACVWDPYLLKKTTTQKFRNTFLIFSKSLFLEQFRSAAFVLVCIYFGVIECHGRWREYPQNSVF